MSWRRFFRRAQWDRDRAAELRSYIEIETDENIARGMSPEAARRAAHIKLGNTVRIREEIYRMNTISPLETLGRDLRLALRGIRRRPGFTLAVILTLALGIGANTAIFGVVDGVLIKPLPYPDADELVSIEQVAPGLNADQLRMSASQYFTYREEGRVFQHIGLYGDGGRTITGLGEPEQARALFVTYDVLLALGIQPQLGRLFTEADATPGPAGVAPVLMLTHAYWQRRFGGDRSVIGRRLIADSNPTEVIGIMPEGFRFLDMEPAAEVISLIALDRSRLTVDGFGYWSLARLKPGMTVADANADIARMLPIWLNAWPISPNVAGRQVFENWRITPVVEPLKDEVVGGVGDMLWILMATIGMVLLIACANVANLMLVRSESRRQEFAVRTALGAGRGHIAREVLVESLVLSLIGGALGVALAYAALQVVVATAPTTLPRVEDISLDPRAMGFAIAVSLLSSMLFGALPALKHAAQHGTPLGGTARGASTSRERQRTRNSLVVVQVALALVLLIGSGLMIRTFRALLDVEPGFGTTADLQTARVWVPPQQVQEPERVVRIQHEILDKVAALPGVTAAAFASAVPMEGPLRVWTQAIYVDGQKYDPGTVAPLRRIKTVSPGYFNAIGTRMIAGRDITWNDIYGRVSVTVISENFAREIWGSPAAALGQRIRESPTAPVWREIVGIVEDVHEDAVHQAAPGMVYWPTMMENYAGARLFSMRPVNLVIRSEQAGRESLLAGVRSAVSSVNASMPVFLVRTMKDLYDASLARTSFALVMLGIAAAMALMLGVIGIYGVIAYVVAQRSREIGIRLALGAAPATLMRMFVGQGLVLTAVGAGVGLVTAVALTQWMSSLLFGVERLDPPTYAGVLGVLGLAAALASYVPARRAAAVDPVETLTAE
ncbi:MAG TPA: ABC transporter permease [Vicinamibacterales bacterium]|nr:ABC transporter permease [Vicinamibacterales bacterium]